MQGVVVRRIPSTWNPMIVAGAGLSLMALGFYGLSRSSVEWHMFPAIAVMAFGNGVAAPMLTALISRRVSEREQGSILGSTQSVISATRVVGPLIAGYAFDRLGAGSPYWLGALMTVASVAVILRARNNSAA
jgi:DHA1 family tetracycline resistance protein-like MFS transporter